MQSPSVSCSMCALVPIPALSGLSRPATGPPGPPLYPPPQRTSYITFENVGGLNNARMQAHTLRNTESSR